MAKLPNNLARLALWPILLLSQAAVAMGLGDVRLQSTLNEPLDAAIEIITGGSESLNNVAARLADAAAFDRAGIQRPAYLDALSFAIVKPDTGAPYVHVTSKGPFTEPFVHFLVEVEWSNGRLRREYTLLLDPPSTVPRVATAPVVAPPPKTPPPVAAVPATPTPPAAPPASNGAPVMPLRKTPAIAPAPRAPEPVMAAAPQSGQGGTSYGPTRKQETLWGIASKLAQRSGTTPQQMMLALLRSNPDAFYGNNINSLKPGEVLRVPTSGEARALAPDDAVREVRAQNQVWQAIGGDPTRLDRAPVPAPKASAAAPTPAAPTPASPPGKLKIVGGDPATDTEVVAELERLVKEVALANETAESRRLENEDLRDRLGRLEQSVDKMQRLIALKDEEIGNLQRRASNLQARLDTADAPASASPAPAPDATTPAPAPARPAPVPAPAKANVPQPAAQTAAKPAVKPTPMMRPKPRPEPSLLDQILDDPITMIGLSLVVVLLLLGLLWWRHKAAGSQREDVLSPEATLLPAEDDGGGKTKKKKSKLDLAALRNLDVKDLFGRFGKKDKDKGAADAEDDRPARDVAIGVAGGAAALAAAAGIAGAASGDANPIDAAESLFAEQRYADAAARFAQAVEQDPGNEALRVRLLESHHLAGDTAAFEAEAEALYADRGGVEDELWDHIARLGREISPEHPLFTTETVAEPLSEMSGNDDLVALDDLDLGDVGLDDELTGLGADLGEEGGGDLDLDADLDAMLDDRSIDARTGLGEPADTDAELLDGLELEFGDIGGATVPAAPSKPVSIAFTPANNDDLDVEFDVTGSSSTSAEPDADDEAGLEFDLSGLDFGGDDDEEPEIDLGDLVGDDTDEDLSTHLDKLGAAIDRIDGGEVLLSDAELDELDFGTDIEVGESPMVAEPDEVDTKLDLARAYIDMGDPDGARVMLEEVLGEGSATQRQEAQSLIDQIG